MSFEMLLDLLIMACGVYLVHGAVQMKRTNKIPEMLAGKGFKTDRAKDAKGFITYTFPVTVVIGSVLFAAGLLGSLGVFYLYPVADIILRVVTVVSITLYGVLLMKAQKKYLV